MATSPATDELVELAAVVRAHGLSGMVVLKAFNPDSTLLYDVTQVLLRSPSGQLTPITLREVRGHSGSMLCAIEGIKGRDASEALRGSVICVAREQLPEPGAGEHYLRDLVGLHVEDEAGRPLGLVEDVLEYPSVVCLKVVSGDGVLELPHIERYVVEVDVGAGVVRAAHVDELDVLRSQKTRS